VDAKSIIELPEFSLSTNTKYQFTLTYKYVFTMSVTAVFTITYTVLPPYPTKLRARNLNLWRVRISSTRFYLWIR